MGKINNLISDLLSEYDSIRSFFGESITRINDDFDILTITVQKNFTREELIKLLEEVNSFKLFVNPSGLYLSDFLEELEVGIRNVEDISELNIQLEKNYIKNDFEGLDYFFFNSESMINNLTKREFRGRQENKLNIALPEIKSIQTLFFNFLPIDNLSSLSTQNLIEIESSALGPLNIFKGLHKSETKLNYLNPFLFLVENLSNEMVQDEFQEILKRKFYLDVLEFISDQSLENSFLLRGEKTLKITKGINFTTKNYYSLAELFLFLLSGEKFLEKISIVKNVFSIYLHDENSLNRFDAILGDIWKTIQHYFNNYIADDIKDFFKDRDSLFKEAMSVSKSINEQTDRLNSAINNSLVSLVIGVTIAIYTSISRNDFFILFMSILIFLSFSLTYYHLTKKQIKEREGIISDQFEHFINTLYILEENDKKTFKQKYLRDPIDLLDKVLMRFKYSMVWMNVFVLVVFFIFYFRTYIFDFVISHFK